MTDQPPERPEAARPGLVGSSPSMGSVFAEHELAPGSGAATTQVLVDEQDAITTAGSPGPADSLPAGTVRRSARGPSVRRSASLGPVDRVVPTWTDPVVRRASDVIGGPLGRHAIVGRSLIFTPLRVCLAMAIVVLICGWLYKSACIQQMPDGAGGMVLDQGGERPWISGCYNDVVPLYGSHKLDTQQLPYVTSWDDNGATRYMEYPVVTGYWMWGVSEVSKWYGQLATRIGLPTPLPVAGYFTINAILLGLMFLVAVACTARMARRRVWDTAIMCLSPLLIVHAFTNWDLLAVAITAAAMWAWSKGRFDHDRAAVGLGWAVASGALIGVGTAAKLYPVLVLGPLLVLCLRAGRMRHWWAAALTAAAVWAAINVPVMLAAPSGWFEFIRLNSERPAEYDSWYFIVARLSNSSFFAAAPNAASPTFLNWFSLLIFGLACAVIAWLGLSARRRPRVAQLVFLVVAAFLLTNKVWSPQYSLWLLPLVVLALPRWRPVLGWQFAEAAVWILLMLTFDADTGKNLPIYPFLAAAIIRDVLLVSLLVMVVRDILRPERDRVRVAGDDDPTGGVLAGAPDRFRLSGINELIGGLPQLRLPGRLGRPGRFGWSGRSGRRGPGGTSSNPDDAASQPPGDTTGWGAPPAVPAESGARIGSRTDPGDAHGHHGQPVPAGLDR